VYTCQQEDSSHWLWDFLPPPAKNLTQEVSMCLLVLDTSGFFARLPKVRRTNSKSCILLVLLCL